MAQDEPTDLDREFLARIPIFGGLPHSVVTKIVDVARVVRVVAGAHVLREGEHAHSMFVVREGELEICKRSRNGTEYRLAILKPGDCVGEMALIDIQPRSATARALGPATLYVLDQSEIAKLCQGDAEAYALFVLNIAREISRRLRTADQVLVDMGVAVSSLWTDAPPPPGPGSPK